MAIIRSEILGADYPKYFLFAKSLLRRLRLTSRSLYANRSMILDNVLISVSISGKHEYIRIKSLMKTQILLLYVRQNNDAAVDLAFSPNNVGDFRHFIYEFLDGDKYKSALKLTSQKADTMVVSDSGYNLTIQVSGNNQVATVPNSALMYNESIDYLPTDYSGYPYRWWGFTETSGLKMRTIGSLHYPKTTDGLFDYSQDNRLRHNFDLIDGKVWSKNYILSGVILGTGLFAIEDTAASGGGANIVKWSIAYTDSKGISQTKDTGLSDSESGDYYAIDNSPYTWTKVMPISILDENTIMYRKMSRITQNRIHPVTVQGDRKLFQEGWYYASGHGNYVGVTSTVSAPIYTSFNIRELRDDYTEALYVGNNEIETISSATLDTHYQELNVQWNPYVLPYTTTSSPDNWQDLLFPGSVYEGACDTKYEGSIYDNTGYYSGSFDVDTAWNHTCAISGEKTVRMVNKTFPEGSKTSKSGSSGLHVLAYDNNQGSTNYILIYKYSVIEATWVNNVQQSLSSLDKFYLYYYRDGHGIKIALPDKTIYPSVSTNKGYMGYTYVILWSDGTFRTRVVGLINIKAGSAQEFFINDDEKKLEDFKFDHMAAIAII
jgi:hypothetical protein